MKKTAAFFNDLYHENLKSVVSRNKNDKFKNILVLR